MFVGPINPILNGFHDFLIFGWEDFRDSLSLASNGLTIFDGKWREIIRWHSVIGVDIHLVTQKWRSVLLVGRWTTRPFKNYEGSVDNHLTLRVNRQERNFLLSPITIALLINGISALIDFSMGTGAIFSPPAVMINSKNNNKSRRNKLKLSTKTVSIHSGRRANWVWGLENSNPWQIGNDV